MAGKTILIIDDDPGIARLIALMLQHDGFDPIIAHSGQEALARYDAAPPDAILLDLAMPGMTGFDVLRAIRQREQGIRHTPVLFLTAHAQSYFVSREFAIDVDGYIVKPVTPQKLRAELQALLTSPDRVSRAGSGA